MPSFLFLLGTTPELSLRELQSVVGAQQCAHLLPRIVEVHLDSDERARQIFGLLGGSLKVLRNEGEFFDLDLLETEQRIVAYLDQFDKLNFGLAEFGRDNQPKFDLQSIKRQLKELGKSSRFVEGPREGFSASILLHQKEVTELAIIQVQEKTIFAQTLDVQNIDDWTRRDRGKPYANRKKGLLPPKVARMMVNLAVGSFANQTARVLYDPFCGSGTVLMEAQVRGCETIGSDLDKDAIAGTQDNLNWFQKTYPSVAQPFMVFQADVASVTAKQLQKPIDFLVTEPFLGKPLPKVTELPNIFKGLEKMYLGAFKQWRSILNNHAKVVIIFPYSQAGSKVYSLEGMIDKLHVLGYTPLSTPVMYSRLQAVIQRQVWCFEYQHSTK
jgi:tRNA G10  N-methylase Trm11